LAQQSQLTHVNTVHIGRLASEVTMAQLVAVFLFASALVCEVTPANAYRKGNAVIDLTGDGDGAARVVPLPWVEESIRNGRLWLAFELCTTYVPGASTELGWPASSEKTPAVPISVSIPVPAPVGKEVQMEAARSFGSSHAVAVVWRHPVKDRARFGDHEPIHVAFQAAFKSQLWKILFESSRGTMEFEWPELEGTLGGHILLGHYIGWKSEKLWTVYGLGKYLVALASESGAAGQKKRFIFSGISHGAALAQVLSLRFQLALRNQGPESLAEVYGLTWNCYRWTEKNGVALQQQNLAGHVIHFINVLTDEHGVVKKADGVPGFFNQRTSIPDKYLMDQHGQLLECESSCPKDRWWWTPKTALKISMLHDDSQLRPPILAMMEALPTTLASTS